MFSNNGTTEKRGKAKFDVLFDMVFKKASKKGNADLSKRDHLIVLNYFSKLGKSSNSAYGLKN